MFQVTDKLQALNDEFAAMTKKKKDLEDNIDLCSQKLDRLCSIQLTASSIGVTDNMCMTKQRGTKMFSV